MKFRMIVDGHDLDDERIIKCYTVEADDEEQAQEKALDEASLDLICADTVDVLRRGF